MPRPQIQRPSRLDDRDVPPNYQPTRAELDELVTVPGATPDDLLRAVINTPPPKRRAS